MAGRVKTPGTMKVPRVIVWRENVDDKVVAIFAARAYDEPAYSTFKLMLRSDIAWRGDGQWRDWRTVIEQQLRELEDRMIRYYGPRRFLRQWQAWNAVNAGDIWDDDIQARERTFEQIRHSRG